MPDPTAPECIDRASALILAAAATRGEDEKIRLLEGAEAWLLRAKQLLIAAKSGGSTRARARGDVVAFSRYCTVIAFGIQR